jgi:hypothetical protein
MQQNSAFDPRFAELRFEAIRPYFSAGKQRE